MRLPTVLLSLAMVLVAAPARADDHQDHADGHGHNAATDEQPTEHSHSASPAEARPAFGGLGFMHTGVFIGSIGDMGAELSDPLALGAGASSPSFGYSIGGGGRALLWRRLVVGGKGYGLFAPSVGGPNGRATLGGGGGGFELGVAAVNRSKWLFIPFVGVGGMGLGMRVSNTSESAIRFGDGQAIAPDTERDYVTGFAYAELGAGTHRLFFFGGTGGFAVGFDVGALLSFAPATWSEQGGDQLADVSAPKLSGVYARLTLGGGGFSFR